MTPAFFQKISRMVRQAALATVVIIVTPTLATSAPEPQLFAPNAKGFSLDNGLEVVVLPDRRVPIATHMLWYRVGAADEKPGVSGIAHFLEHLMFKGTKARPDGEFSKIVAGLGGQENAFTSQDYTGYFQRVAKEHLGLMMEMEADRMRGLILDDAAVLTERDVILEERRSRVDNEPGGLLSEALSAAFYQSHPYGTPIIGWEHEMRVLDRTDALEFYNQFYAPENAILVVAGDVTVDEVRTLAEQTYGKLEGRGTRLARERPQEPPVLVERRVILKDARVRQPTLQQAYLVPSYTNAKPGEAEALDLLSEIVGGGSTSRLYRALVIDKKVAASVGSWYQSTALDATRFGFYGSPSDGVALEDLETEIETVVADIVENGVTQEDVDRTRNALLADVIYAQDSQVSLARAFGAGLSSGATIKDIQEWPRDIMSVTPEDIQAVARKYLNPDLATTGYLLPADEEDDRS